MLKRYSIVVFLCGLLLVAAGRSFAEQQKILVVYEGYYYFSQLVSLLKNKGYQADLYYLENTQITDELLHQYTQFWMFDSNPNPHRTVTDKEVNSVLAFQRNGGGVFLAADHQYRPGQSCRYGGDYTVNFDRFAKNYSVECIGCMFNPSTSGSAWSLFAPVKAEHEIWSGIEQIIAHDSECEMKVDNPSMQIIGSMQNGYPILAVKDPSGNECGQGRIALDTTFGRYTDGLLTWGNDQQYALNVAKWLSEKNICNTAPTAVAGPDRVIECAGPGGSTITLDGSGSFDPDGDALSYLWTWSGGSASGAAPTVTLPYGATTVTLTVDDGKGSTATDTVLVTIRDTTPPVTTVRGIAGIAGNNGWYRSDVTITVDSTDSCSGVKEIRSGVDGNAATTPGSTAVIPVQGDGSHVVAFGATDNAGNVEQQKTLTIKIDKTAPAADISVTPGLLWPPNHKMVDVLVSGGSSDGTSGVATVIFTVTDEYGKVQPVVSGFNTTVPLEAWREGTDKDGRHYMITAVITDEAGNTTTVSTGAICPHDMRDKQ